MLFNSFEFLVFFPIVVTLYFLLPHLGRRYLLLIASYYFYASWKPAYLLLILFSTLVDYGVGLWLGDTADKRKRQAIILLSLVVNLGFLGFFKYYNFFSQISGLPQLPFAKIILPVGISFYTFQSLSYTLDVYRRKIAPVKNLGLFALYVSFFPQLVAGPIERAGHMVPQYLKVQRFEVQRLFRGLQWMLWGFFKKLVIADRLAPFVNQVFNHPENSDGATVLLATYFFAIQIYCDFSGYSDIALGAADIMGIDLLKNFRRPYLASSVREFWTRWHIALSTWFRDYLYFPLGGNRVSEARHYFNLLITFLISGLWHGANWTFIAWGALHGLYMIVHDLWQKVAKPWRLPKWLATLLTFHAVLFAWIFFRANSLADVQTLCSKLFSLNYHWASVIEPLGGFELWVAGFFIVVLFSIEWLMENDKIWQRLTRTAAPWRWAAIYSLVILVWMWGRFTHAQFIYFQF